RRAHPALRSRNFYPESYEPHFNAQGYGLNLDKGVVIYHRWGERAAGGLDRYIVVLNCSTLDQWVDGPFPPLGPSRALVGERSEPLTEFGLRGQRIEANWGRVFHLEDA